MERVEMFKFPWLQPLLTTLARPPPRRNGAVGPGRYGPKAHARLVRRGRAAPLFRAAAEPLRKNGDWLRPSLEKPWQYRNQAGACPHFFTAWFSMISPGWPGPLGNCFLIERRRGRV